MKRFVGIAIVLLFVPGIVWADIRITEIAWMGTASSQYSEWLELYNDGESSVDLGGWKLYEGDGGVLVFTFTKSIPAGEYLLLERTTASAPDAVLGVDDEAGPFGGGGFANTGEHLLLKDDSGSVVDELDFLGGWPAGDASTKDTMQWNGDMWVTAAATPKEDGAGEGEAPSPSAEIKDPKDPFPIPPVSPNSPHIEFTIPPTTYRGVRYQFEARPVFEYNYRVNEGTIYWNMGDGTVFSQRSVAPVMHTYQYPGTYVISYAYSDVFHAQAPLKGTKKIQVSTPALELAVLNTTALQIKNTSSTSVDLSGWKIIIPGKELAIPEMTVIAEKATVVVPVSAFGIVSIHTASIVDPSGSVVARSDSAPQKEVSARAAEISTNEVEYEYPLDQDDVVEALGTDQSAKTHIQNRTKIGIFGAVALFVIVLSILLERFMAQQEYSDQ